MSGDKKEEERLSEPSGAPPSSIELASSASSSTLQAPGSSIPSCGKSPRIRTESMRLDSPAPSGITVKSSFAALRSDSYCQMVDYGVTSEQGSRRTMEDQHKIILSTDPVTPRESLPPQSPLGIPFFGVYDGHAGTQCAEYLKRNLHGIILAHPLIRHDPEIAIKEGIAEAERDFMEKCRTEKYESGSTAALGIIIGDKLITANVGDSEIVMCRGTEPLVLTTKHHLSCNESEMERVKACGGRIYHSRVGHPKFNPQLVSLAVTRAIGDAGFKLEEYTDGKASGVIADAETKVTKLLPEDRFFIIGCDGLWDVFSYVDAVHFCLQLLESGVSSQEISKAIVEEALRKGSTDNVTVLFVNLHCGKSEDDTTEGGGRNMSGGGGEDASSPSTVATSVNQESPIAPGSGGAMNNRYGSTNLSEDASSSVAES